MREISALSLLFLLGCAGSAETPREASTSSAPVGVEVQAPSAPSLDGWTLLATEVWQSPRALSPTQTVSSGRMTVTWAAGASSGFGGVSELLLDVPGTTPVFVAAWPADSEETPLLGVTPMKADGDGALLVWAWRPSVVTLIAARHHPRTGRRLSPAVAVRGQPPHFADRPQRLYSTRPLPVVGHGGVLLFALHQGDERALLFEEPGDPGYSVAFAGAPSFDVASVGAPDLLFWADGTLAPR